MIKMETQKNELETKIEEAERQMPGVAKMLGRYSNATWGMHWSGSPTDIKYIETDEYKVIVAKINEHEWSEDGGGIQWKEWMTVYCMPKTPRDTLRGIGKYVSQQIVTRHMSNPNKDRTDLWHFHKVYAEVIDASRIKIAWAKEEGELGPEYTIDLNKIEDAKQEAD
jgi:hypothetical protein